MPTRKTGTTGSRPKATSRSGKGERAGSAQMTSLQELFKHELADMYSAEHLLLNALEELEAESTHRELGKAFAEHRQQTQGHIARLEEVAELLDEELEAAECHGIEGLIEEKKAFAKERPSPQILDVFNCGAGQKSERYEMTSYEGLIEMAQKLGHPDAVTPLRANMAEEEAALKTLKNLSGRLEAPTATAEPNNEED